MLVGQQRLAERLSQLGADPYAPGWLDPVDYAVTGGSVPVRVAGAGVMAAVTVSGLASEDDHRLAASCMRAYVRQQRESQPT